MHTTALPAARAIPEECHRAQLDSVLAPAPRARVLTRQDGYKARAFLWHSTLAPMAALSLHVKTVAEVAELAGDMAEEMAEHRAPRLPTGVRKVEPEEPNNGRIEAAAAGRRVALLK